MLRRLWLASSFVLSFACAGEPGPPSVEGESPAEQAAIVTDVVCEWVATCGVVSVVCADCDGDDCGGCTVEHEPTSYDGCVAEVAEDYEARFACEPPDADQVATIDACLAALVDLPCPDVDAIEEWANGGDGEDPRKLPAACEAADRLGRECDDEPVDTGVMPEPG